MGIKRIAVTDFQKVRPIEKTGVKASWEGIRIYAGGRWLWFKIYQLPDADKVQGKNPEDLKLMIEKIEDTAKAKPIRVYREGLSDSFSDWWAEKEGTYYLYKNNVYQFDWEYSEEEILLLIMDYEDKERRKFEQLKKKFELTKQVEREPRRESIPEEVRIAVWRRDGGKCARCGGREKLEYDHIIPISKGGSNTVRNIELLCERCNRKKKDNII